MLPQYLFVLPCEHVWSHLFVRTDLFYNYWVDNYVLQYYEKVVDQYYWDRSKIRSMFVDYVYKRDVFKLKPEYEHRMITKGYEDAGEKSLGKYFDIDRAFQGFPSPLTNRLKHPFEKK